MFSIRPIYLFTALLILTFAACKKDDPSDSNSDSSPTNDQNDQNFPQRKNQPIQGSLFGKSWEAISHKINFRDQFTPNTGNTMMVTFFDTLSSFPCTQDYSIPASRRTTLWLKPTQLGWQELEDAWLNYPPDSTYSGYWSNLDDDESYLYVEEFDSTGEGYFSAYYYYRSTKFPPPISFPPPTTGGEEILVEGYFSGTLCRSSNRLEYKEQDLKGIFNGQNWQYENGKADDAAFAGPRIDMLGYQYNLSCDSFPPLPNLEWRFPPFLELKEYLSDSLQLQNHFFLARKTTTPEVLEGGVVIEEIDTVNMIVKGKADLFSLNKPYYFNGNFEIPYCQ